PPVRQRGIGFQEQAGRHGVPRRLVEARPVRAMARVQRRQGGGVEERGGAKQPADDRAVLLAGEGGDRHGHLRRADAAEGIAARVARDRAGRVRGHPETRGARRRLPRPRPPVERREGGVQHEVLRSGVDRRAAGDDPGGKRLRVVLLMKPEAEAEWRLRATRAAYVGLATERRCAKDDDEAWRCSQENDYGARTVWSGPSSTSLPEIGRYSRKAPLGEPTQWSVPELCASAS